MKNIDVLAAKRFLAAEEKYIMLSAVLADQDRKISYPRVSKMQDNDDKQYIIVFSSYDMACRYAELYGYEKIGEDYPIAKLPENMDELASFLIGAVNSYIDYILIVTDISGGPAFDTLNFVQNMPIELDMSMLRMHMRPLAVAQKQEATKLELAY